MSIEDVIGVGFFRTWTWKDSWDVYDPQATPWVVCHPPAAWLSRIDLIVLPTLRIARASPISRVNDLFCSVS